MQSVLDGGGETCVHCHGAPLMFVAKVLAMSFFSVTNKWPHFCWANCIFDQENKQLFV